MTDLTQVLVRVREMTGRSFAERDLVVLEREGFTLVVLADDLMAYVPSNGMWRRRLLSERRALARVATRVSFDVPRPVGPIDALPDVRVPARGMTGSAHHERLMRDPDLAERAAVWMGKALAELHASLTRSELDALETRRPSWPLPQPDLERIVDAELEGGLRDAAHRVLDRWVELRGASTNEVFVHGDFASHNFSFDERTGMPTGLFDFHDGGRGPRVLDFALLPSYGEAVLERAVAAYGRDAPPIAEIRLAHAACAIAYLSTKSSSVAWVKSSVSAAGFSIL